MFTKSLGIAAFAGTIALTACGAGGSGGGAVGSGGLYGGAPPTTPPQQHSNVPIRQAVAGNAAFVNPWDCKHHPLCNYSGDNGPDQANGNGIPFAGGH